MSHSDGPQGIVYILTNEAMPGYVKIGRTDGDLATRVTGFGVARDSGRALHLGPYPPGWSRRFSLEGR